MPENPPKFEAIHDITYLYLCPNEGTFFSPPQLDWLWGHAASYPTGTRGSYPQSKVAWV